MSQQSNRKSAVTTYNYDPRAPKNPQPEPLQEKKVIVTETPLDISRQLKFKQQYSNIFHIPDKEQLDYSQFVRQQHAESIIYFKLEILPYDVQWWNSQLLKENKQEDRSPFQVLQNHNDILGNQKLAQSNLITEREQELLKQQRQLQEQQEQFRLYQLNQIQLLNQERKQLSEARQSEPTERHAHFDDDQKKNQQTRPQTNEVKVNNPNADQKMKNRQYSDILGGGLEKYYQDQPRPATQNKKNEVQTLEESNLYGPQFHQRQMLKGMASVFDTHNYYNQALDDQQRKRLPEARSNRSSPGKGLEKDEVLFPKPKYTEFTIRGLNKDVNLEKFEQNNISIANVEIVKDKNQKVKLHKIVVKHLNDNLQAVKLFITGNGGRIIDQTVIESETEFRKLLTLKEGPKQKPLTITQEKALIKKKRPQSAVPTKKK